MTIKDVVSEGFRLLTQRENDASILDMQIDLMIDQITHGKGAYHTSALDTTVSALKNDDLNKFLLSHIELTPKGC